MYLNRTILGTVQLGLPYGIANTTGKPDQVTANTLIREAWQGGITFFDTAKGYGESEAVLGQALRACDATEGAQVITKLPIDLQHNGSTTRTAIVDSLQKISVPRLYGVMLHREEQLSALDGNVGDGLAEMQREGVVDHIGISVYSPTVAYKALLHPCITFVQLPSSIFDRRFVDAGIFKLAKKLGKNIHIRSVLLQGVLTMSADKLPSYLDPLVPYVRQFHTLCACHRVTPAFAALAWAFQYFTDSFALFGAETREQVLQNLTCASMMSSLSDEFFTALTHLVPPQDANLLNPALWGK